MHRLHQRLDVFHRDLGSDAVAQVENVSWPRAVALQDRPGLPGDGVRVCGENGGVEVALEHHLITPPVPVVGQGVGPIDPQDGEPANLRCGQPVGGSPGNATYPPTSAGAGTARRTRGTQRGAGGAR